MKNSNFSIRLNMNNKKKYTIAYVILVCVTALLLMMNIGIGTVSIPAGKIVELLLFRRGDSSLLSIVWQIRFPRTLGAAILGGALALSGYLLQTFFHNPIAGPYVLGISSGAKLCVALLMVFGLRSALRVNSLMMVCAAFFGALLATMFVLLLSKVLPNMAMLIVGGVMIGYICTAVTDFVVTFAADANIVNLHNWSKGCFSGISWENVLVMAIVCAGMLFCTIWISKPMSAYQMGESYAKNMGVNILLFRMCLIGFSSILSACVTAFAGPVSFVGIAVPQLMKKLLGTAKPVLMIPACFLGGAAFCLLCDLIARTVFAPTELSISTVTAVFGAPVVIWVLVRRKGEKRY